MPESQTAAAPTVPAERARVLVIDDEKGPRESLRIILSGQYDVAAVASATEAISRLRASDFDLVTIDLNMPGMKGDELIRTVREQFPEVGVVVITGCGSLASAVEGIRCGINDYLPKPFDVVQVTSAVSRAIDQKRSRRRLIDFLESLGSALGREGEAGRESDEILRQRLRQLLAEQAPAPAAAHASFRAGGAVEFLEVLAESIENRDIYMRGHARRVAFYASLLAEQLELSGDEREHVRISAFLHDLGKVGVPSHVLESPDTLDRQGSLSMHAHVAIGERLVGPLGFSAAVRSAIRHHHERWDGTGYADALRAEEIPLASRVIAVCDAFDAMTCDRPYRDRMNRVEALAELNKHAGSQFDPTLVAAFTHVVESGHFELRLVDESDDASAGRMGDPS